MVVDSLASFYGSRWPSGPGRATMRRLRSLRWREPRSEMGSGRAGDARRTPFSRGAIGARLAPCFPNERMMRWQMTSESRRFRPSSTQLPRRCEPPAACWRCQRHAWCRPPTAAIPASVAATSVLRRAGRPRRRHPTKGSPAPLLGSTTPPTQRGWQDGAATKQDGPSRRCFANPRTHRRDERRDAGATRHGDRRRRRHCGHGDLRCARGHTGGLSPARATRQVDASPALRSRRAPCA